MANPSAQDNDFDVAIVGGGIAGLGVAREASKLGLRVCVFERHTVSHGTSAGSLRIMHGGFRYLQSLNFGRVLESMRAQSEIAKLYPQLVSPLNCVMPLDAFGLRSRLPVRCALLFYRLLYRLVIGTSYEGSVIGGETQTRSFFKAPHGVLHWRDLLLQSPEGLAMRLCEEIRDCGGQIREGANVVAIETTRRGAEISLHNEQLTARCAVNCAGIGAEHLRPLRARSELPSIRWCRAFNIILNKKLSNETAVGLRGRGRLFFTVPRDGVSVIGTEYLPIDSSVSVTDAEAAKFLDDFCRVAPGAGLSRADIAAVESGVLPLRIDRDSGMELQGKGCNFVVGNYIEMLTTKYTTFLSQGREVARIAKMAL